MRSPLQTIIAFTATALAGGSLIVACDAGGGDGGGADIDVATPGTDPGSPGASGADGGASASADGGTSTPATGRDAAPTPDVDTGPPAVQLIGRFDTSEPAGPKCGWPGCRIVARFDGTAVSAKLEEIHDTWMEGAPSEWDVSIDGVITKKIRLDLGVHDYALASELAPGPHTVELYKRSESQTGIGRFMGFDFAGGQLLSPPPRLTRRLEIIGDSQPAAFGVEGVGFGPQCPGVNWSGQWQNFRKSFGARLGDTFQAEVFGTVYSGKGMAQNIWSTDDDTMPILYKRANPLDKASTWDFSWTPDVVVIMIGGNDFAVGQPFDRGPTTLAAFSEAYRTFVAELRGRYPQAWLFLVTSPSVSDAMPEGRASRTNVMAGIASVMEDRAAANDTRVAHLVPAIAQPSELVGCDGHGSPEFHDRVAAELATSIRAKTGWN